MRPRGILLCLLVIDITVTYIFIALANSYHSYFLFVPGIFILYATNIALLFAIFRYPLLFLNIALKLFPRQSRYLAYRGVIYSQRKKYEFALKDLDRALELNPTLAEAYYFRSRVFLELREYQRTLQDCDQALIYRPRYPEAYFSKNIAYRALKKPDQALENLNQALRLSPGKQSRILIYKWRSAIYQQKEEYRLALQDLHSARNLSPNDEDIYNSCAMAHIMLREYLLAVYASNRAIAIKSQFGCAYDNRGRAYLGLNNLQQASMDFERAWKLDPTHITHGWHIENLRLCQEQPNQEMARRLDVLAQVDNEHKLTYVCKGVAHWIRGASEEALLEFDRSIEFEPIQWDAHFWKGVVLASLARDEEAKEAIQAALDYSLPPILLSPLRWVKPALYQELVLVDDRH